MPFDLSDLDFKTDTAENVDGISVHSEAKRRGGEFIGNLRYAEL